MKNVAPPRKTVALIRVSTDDQAKEGVSLDAQRQRIEAYALAMGRTIDEFITEAGESAKSLKRPGMARVLEEVKSGRIGALLIFKLDRATRSVKDLLHIIEVFGKAEADLISVSESLDTSSAAGRMVVQILGVMAEFERAQLAERTAFALGHKRRCRRVYGKAPFGFRRDGSVLVENPDELSALQAAHRMRVEGISLRRIGEWLRAQGHVPPQGGKEWRKQSVAQVLGSRMAQEVARCSSTS
jgi:DNA invertase Pin-like site-specific DNA recombinase